MRTPKRTVVVGRPVSVSRQALAAGVHATLQGDGNFVIYANDGWPVWSTMHGTEAAFKKK